MKSGNARNQEKLHTKTLCILMQLIMCSKYRHKFRCDDRK